MRTQADIIQLTSDMVTELMGDNLIDSTSHIALKKICNTKRKQKPPETAPECHTVLLAWRSNSTFDSLIDLSAVAARVSVKMNTQSHGFIKLSRFCSMHMKDFIPVSLEKNTRNTSVSQNREDQVCESFGPLHGHIIIKRHSQTLVCCCTMCPFVEIMFFRWWISKHSVTLSSDKRRISINLKLTRH